MGIVSGEEKADTLLCLRGARSRFEGPIGSFSIYVCGLGDIRALFFLSIQHRYLKKLINMILLFCDI